MYFDREKIRLWLTLAWLVTFGCIWYGFYVGLNDSNKKMLSTLDRLESNVIQEDWEEAWADISLINNTYKEDEFLIKVSNSPEDLATFRRMLVETTMLVKNREKDVIAQIGGLKEEIQTITTVFPGT